MFKAITVAASLAASATLAGAAHADPLAGLVSKARPVVVLAAAPTDARFARQIAALDAEAKTLADYDIAVVRVTTSKPGLRRKLGVAPQGFAVVLVGKDGGVKERWTEPVDPARILALIDRMPMRQDEVRARR